MTERERGCLTPASSIHASGYHTPDNQTTRSSSPGSAGSFHTANPIDSERSSPTVHTDLEGWETPRPEYLSSVEVPSLEGDNTPLVGEDRPYPKIVLPTPDTEEEVTLRNNPSPPRSMAESRIRGAEGEARNWIGQPKLVPADSETVPPCPEKKPLPENSLPRNRSNDAANRETTPLLRSNTSTQSSECDCCVLL